MAPADATPPAGVKVTPIPPPSLPYSFAGASTASPPPPGASSGAAATSPTATLPAPPPNPPSTLPQKRALVDEDHTPAVRSPLNPAAADDVPNVAVRERRAKKDSLKKRESKAAAAAENRRPTPEPRRTKEGTPGGGGGGGGGATDTGSLAGSSTSNPHDHAASLSSSPSDSLPVRVRLAGPLRPSDIEPPASPLFRSHHVVEVAVAAGDKEQEEAQKKVEFHELFSEQPINRRGYVYESAIADPLFPALHYFRQTEPQPHYAHFSFEDAPPNVFFDQSGLHINGEAGFRTARANVAARQGRWYWECKVTRGIVRQGKEELKKEGGKEPPSHGHVRMGWARREASRDAPVGYDAYGYGIRDRKGQKVHMSRPKELFAVQGGEGAVGVVDCEDLCEGDVLGLEIQLPSEALHRKVVLGTYNPAVDRDDVDVDVDGDDDDPNTAAAAATTHHEDTPNIVRDRIPFRFQTTKPVFEKFDYLPTRELEDLANPAPTLTNQGANGSGSGGGTTSTGTAPKRDGPVVGPSGGEPPNPHHAVPCLRTLPGSYIRIYKNGRAVGDGDGDAAWRDLLAFLPPASTTNSKIQEGARERLDDGTLGYYPAVSVFRGGAVEVNFGPDFWYPPEGFKKGGGDDGDDVTMGNADSGRHPPPTLTTLRPMSERYAEQIAEDIVYDIVDEVYFWMLDGGTGGGKAAENSTRTARAAAEDGKEED